MAVVGESAVSEDKPPAFGSFESSVLRNLAASNSVRTTIPAVIAALIGAAPGTVLVWSFDSATKAVTVRVKSGRDSKKSSKRT